MEVESIPAGPDVATRFGRAVTHDNGGVFYSKARSGKSRKQKWRPESRTSNIQHSMANIPNLEKPGRAI
jgi:hypothetical protein